MSWLSSIFKPESETCPVCESDMADAKTGIPITYVDSGIPPTGGGRETDDWSPKIPKQDYDETCGRCGDFAGESLQQIKQGQIGEF